MTDRTNRKGDPIKKVALVTGAGRGIGKAIALRLAETGMPIALNDLNAESLDLLVEQVRSLGCEAMSVPADVSKRDAVVEMINIIKANWGHVAVLVNNAGIEHRAPLIKHSEEAWDQVLRVNLKGPFLCCQAAVPGMIALGWGRIINIASMAYRGQGGQVAYDSSKAGLVGMSKSLALDLAKYGITVNAVCPAWVETDMVNTPDLLKLKDKLINRMPMRRLARPEEIAHVVAFLASEDSSYLSGQNINVEGAWLR